MGYWGNARQALAAGWGWLNGWQQVQRQTSRAVVDVRYRFRLAGHESLCAARVRGVAVALAVLSLAAVWLLSQTRPLACA